MAKVQPPPVLIVRPQRSPRQWRRALLLALAWLASILVVVLVQFQLGNVADHSALLQARKERDDLLKQAAVAQRGEQVAKAASGELQQSLRDRQEEIAGLRADLAFYSRLTDGHSKPEGLSVHGIHLKPGAAAHVYNFTVTLTQTLKSGEVSNGHVRVSVSGVRAGKLVTLGWGDVAPNQDATGLPFSFKYFQQISGSLMLPDDFTPNRIRVDAGSGGDAGRVDQEFAWSDALTAQELADVQHQP
jgi:hypothetical protein